MEQVRVNIIDAGGTLVIDLRASPVKALLDSAVLEGVRRSVDIHGRDRPRLWVLPEESVTGWLTLTDVALVVVVRALVGLPSGTDFLYVGQREVGDATAASFRELGLELTHRFTVLTPQPDGSVRDIEIDEILTAGGRTGAPQTMPRARVVGLLAAVIAAGMLLGALVVELFRIRNEEGVYLLVGLILPVVLCAAAGDLLPRRYRMTLSDWLTLIGAQALTAIVVWYPGWVLAKRGFDGLAEIGYLLGEPMTWGGVTPAVFGAVALWVQRRRAG